MPVRSLNSVVLRWPDRAAVHGAAKAWAERAGAVGKEIQRIGYFGSYATGKWGVGSDLDVVILVDATDIPFAGRGQHYPVAGIPVPCEVVVYTSDEWRQMIREGRRFPLTVEAEAVWLYER